MVTPIDRLSYALVAVIFTTLGVLKVYGWKKGVIGGGGKPTSCRLLGRCPSWSKQVNIFIIILFLGIGIVNLGLLLKALVTPGN
jgi:hypothetical protein